MSTLTRRAELGKLWYDELRPAVLEKYDPIAHRKAVVYDLATTARGDLREIKYKLADHLELPSDEQVALWNLSLPSPVFLGDLTESLSRSLYDLRRGKLAVSDHLIGEYARHLLAAAGFAALACSSPAEVMVSESKLVQSVLDSSRGAHEPMDLWRVPFPRTWWEFSKPILIGGIAVQAVAFVADPALEVAVAALLSRNKSTIGYASYLYGQACGVTTGDMNFPFVLRDERTYQDAIGRLWDFVTARNVSYQVVRRKRSRIKYLGAGYSHLQGENAVVRQVAVLSVDRTIRVPEERMGTGASPHEWANRVLVPGAFHRWVYCERCSDVHRHDLIGAPCRRCGLAVGPRANIRVEKYWHSPYYRGPEGAPIKETVRLVRKSKAR